MPTAPVHLEWVAPAGCPSREEMVGTIERIVGANAPPSAVEARVVVTEDEREFHAEVTVTASGATSTRGLAGESCRAVADAATLVIALAANPDAGASPSAVPMPALARRVERTSPPPPPTLRLPFFVEASFLVDSGLLPSPGLGAELGVGWSSAHLNLEIAGSFLGPQRTTLASTPSQGADAWLAQLGARACYELFGARLDVGPCLGGGIEWITARGFGSTPDEPANATGTLGVGSLGGRAVFRLSPRLALRLLSEAIVPWERPTFVIGGGGQVFETSAASFRAMLGAEAHF